MTEETDLTSWFEANRLRLETAYATASLPWQQSGVGLNNPRDFEYWTAIRKPVTDCLDRAGTFLDVGCANGFLLECVQVWVAERGLAINPYGLDISARLVALARERLPDYAGQLFVGNAWDWLPPCRFDFVRTELVYVPNRLHIQYVQRLLDLFLNPGGRLLVAHYQSGQETGPPFTLDHYLTQLGFALRDVKTARWDGLEKTRIAVIQR